MSFRRRRLHRHRRAAPGLSLIELLMAILIIGIIGSLATMFLGSGLTDEAQKQRDKRNAQTIASLASMAGAAGADFFVEGDKAATVENLRTGCSPPTGVFKGRVFKLSGITEEDIATAMPYLKITDSALVYDSGGGN